MAADALSDQDISCMVCLDILANPTTLFCGHNFCMDCVVKYWETSGSPGVRLCPVCRETFPPGLSLRKNTMVERMVETLRRKPPVGRPSCPRGAVCDVCSDSEKLEAAKRCEDCEMSFCLSHLSTHLQRYHVLHDVLPETREKLCPRHGRLLDMYCREDRTCICRLCNADEHQSHETVSVETERAQRQDELIAIQRTSGLILEEREKLQRRLGETVAALKASAQSAEDYSEGMFREMTGSMEKRRAEVREGIRRKTRALLGQAEQAQARLQTNITTLRNNGSALDELSSTADCALFLQRWQPSSFLPEHNPNIRISEKASFEVVKTVINEFKQRFDGLSSDSLDNLGHTFENVLVLEAPVSMATTQDKQGAASGHHQQPANRPLPTVRQVNTERHRMLLRPTPPTASLRISKLPNAHGIPRTRTDFSQYACQLTFDPRTAHPSLVLSAVVVVNPKSQQCSPWRCDPPEQVLCREGLAGGRFYWEAEWSGKGVSLGVTRQADEKRGSRTEHHLGYDENSWSLRCSGLHYSAWHNNMETMTRTKVLSPRIGVYLDHHAGTLDFYSVSGSMVHLHGFSLDGSEPLYAGFGAGKQSSVRLCRQ